MLAGSGFWLSRPLSNFYEASYDPKSMQETEMEELGKVSGAMTSRIIGSVGDCVPLCTIMNKINIPKVSAVKVPYSDIKMAMTALYYKIIITDT